MATQNERRETTRRLIVDVGVEFFGSVGFEATTIDQIASQAGVAKGAVYHHFPNKRAVFEAVFEATAAKVAQGMLVSGPSVGDPTEALMQATRSFFDICSRPDTLRILLQDGPAVLGHADWHRLDSEYFGGLVTAALSMAMESGAIRQQPVGPLSRVILGAIQAAAIDCASQNNYDLAVADYLNVFEGILAGLK